MELHHDRKIYPLEQELEKLKVPSPSSREDLVIINHIKAFWTLSLWSVCQNVLGFYTLFWQMTDI